MSKLLSGRLPEPPVEYDQRQFSQFIRQLEEILNKDVELHNEAEDKEAMDFFLSN